MKEPRILPTARDKTLFTPGPLTTSLSVKQAMLHDIGSRDGTLVDLVRDIRVKLLTLAGVTREDGYETILMQGSGTFAVESVISSVVPQNGALLALVNGAYSRRIIQIASAIKIRTVILEYPENESPRIDQIDRTLREHPEVTHVATVHCETTTGLLNPISEIGQCVKSQGREFIVDAMSSFGGVMINPLRMGIDYLISSANKCLEGVPGIGFVIARRESLLTTEGRARSLSLDLLGQLKGFDETGQFRFTPPTHVLLAFDQALRELGAEGGIEARAARYRKNHERLSQGMKKLGFRPFLEESRQSFIVTAFLYPADSGFSFSEFYLNLRNRGVIIYPGKVSDTNTFRISCIGRIFESDVQALLAAISETLNAMAITLR